MVHQATEISSNIGGVISEPIVELSESLSPVELHTLPSPSARTGIFSRSSTSPASLSGEVASIPRNLTLEEMEEREIIKEIINVYIDKPHVSLYSFIKFRRNLGWIDFFSPTIRRYVKHVNRIINRHWNQDGLKQLMISKMMDEISNSRNSLNEMNGGSVSTQSQAQNLTGGVGHL